MSTRLVRLAATVGAAAAVGAGVAACGDPGQPVPPGSNGPVTVVASTEVWASVVRAVGADRVRVTSIVAGAADPHSHQVSAKDAATLRGAELVVYNGGGYDDFVEQSLGGPDAGGPRRIIAFDVRQGAGGGANGGTNGGGNGGTDGGGSQPPTTQGVHIGRPAVAPEHETGNEHVWYDLPTVSTVTGEIASQLSALRPAASATFNANADAFDAKLDGLEGRVAAIASANAGRKVIATEPVAHYLLEAAKLDDVTPDNFVDAVEEETDPPAAAFAEIQDLVTGRRVDVLVHNPQTETPVITDLLGKARAAHLPVVDMTETPPSGQDYLTWMGLQIQALSEALSRR